MLLLLLLLLPPVGWEYHHTFFSALQVLLDTQPLNLDSGAGGAEANKRQARADRPVATAPFSAFP
jgi:hypothetical protein